MRSRPIKPVLRFNYDFGIWFGKTLQDLLRWHRIQTLNFYLNFDKKT